MKTKLTFQAFLLLCLLSRAQFYEALGQEQTKAPIQLEFKEANSGPHHTTFVATNELGRPVSVYTQLETGLNYWSEADKKYLPATASINIENNHAIVQRAQYQAIFPACPSDQFMRPV